MTSAAHDGPSRRDRYFIPLPFERAGSGRIYERLGIRLYKRYLPTSGDLVSHARGVRHVDRSGIGLLPSLQRIERRTRVYEARHIFGALSMLAISWWSIAVHHRGNWLVLSVANLLINGYPIMLQRYNRTRVYAIRERLASGTSPPPL
ncbi:hypothetical protein EG831_06495 [bacterium]|nr:hypothetical protein [bacterium]